MKLSKKIETDAEGLMRLFEGNAAGFGKHKFDDGGNCSNWTVHGKVPLHDFYRHVMGVEGLGVVPIRSDNKCMFGCIDYDAHHNVKKHGADFEVDLVGIDRKAHNSHLPVLTCRSKSGGAHLYVFFSQPVPAVKVKQLLAKWAKSIGLVSDTEIFPKQSIIRTGQIGNTINIPYFHGDETNRYCLHNGKKLNTTEFLEASEDNRISLAEVNNLLAEDHGEAPPCIQRMMQDGVTSGNRNEALYNITIYMRKRNPATFKDDVADVNNTAFAKPLPSRELRRTIQSASNKDYRYRCKESPCRDLCDRDLCIHRKFGIDDGDVDDDDIYGQLVKHRTDPVQWVITVQGRHVLVNTRTLMDHRRLVEAVADETTSVIPDITPPEWRRKLTDLMEHAKEEDAPDDATVGGALMSKLSEFVKKARPPISCTDDECMIIRESLHRGQPIAELNDCDDCVVHFRGRDFVDYLKRTRHGDVRGATVWMALRKGGVACGKIRIGRSIISVWSVAAAVTEDDMVVPDFFRNMDF